MIESRKGALVCALVCAGAASLARASVTSVVYGSGFGDRLTLQSVGVQRGASNYLYSYANLLSPTLEAANLSATGTSAILLYADPLDANRHLALSDAYLNTGFLHPGAGNGDFTSASAKYIKLHFPTPVKNDVGPDLVMFGIGWIFSSGPSTSSRTYISFNQTDAYLVNREADLQMSQMENTPYYAYSNGVATPAELSTKTPQLVGYLGNPPSAIPTPVVHSLDLSDYGIAAGATIDSMYLQEATTGSDLYPTLIAGLPAIPEPASGLLIAVGGLALLRGRRRAG